VRWGGKRGGGVEGGGGCGALSESVPLLNGKKTGAYSSGRENVKRPTSIPFDQQGHEGDNSLEFTCFNGNRRKAWEGEKIKRKFITEMT